MSRLRIDIDIPRHHKAAIVSALGPGENLSTYVARQAVGAALYGMEWTLSGLPCSECGGQQLYIEADIGEYVCTECGNKE